MTSRMVGPTRTMVTTATGHSLGELAESAWERVAGDSLMIFEGHQLRGDALGERARRLSAGLRAAGLQSGDRVVVCMANCPEVNVTYQAVWRAGAVLTPVLFLVSSDELRHVLTDSGARFIVTTPEFLPLVTSACEGIPSVGAVVVAQDPGGAGGSAEAFPRLAMAELEAGFEGPLIPREPSDLAALLYTGGTTGRSKGVMISHDALSAAAWSAVASGDDGQEMLSRVLLPLPLSHAYGLMVTVMGLHITEPTYSVLMRWFDAAGWLRLAQDHQCQISAVVPSMLQMILAEPVEDYDLAAMRRIASGGAPLPAEIVDEVERRLPDVAVGEGYGCTESAGVIATQPAGARRHGSVGMPAPGVDVCIVGPDGAEVAVGDEGEICARGPMVMSGYWHSAEETAEALRAGWLHTGDIGRMDGDGYLYVIDRLKDLIIRGGFNVYPRDIEEALLAHPDIVGCAVVGRPDPKLGEEVVAYVQLRPGATVSEREVIAFARAHVSAAKYPREVHLVEAIPLTSVGKTDRKALRGSSR